MRPRPRRLLGTIATVLALLVLVPGVALAAWVASGSGNGYSKAITMPTGSTPTLVRTGRSVKVSWTASFLQGMTQVGGYLVKRYDSATSTSQTVGSACSGTVAALSCTENPVPAGTWYYTVTPRQAGWSGTEGSASATVTVPAPSLSFSSSTNVKTLPITLSGTVASFIAGETVTFRLDDATSGTVLSGTVTTSPIPANGSSAVTVTIPSTTADGSHTVYAVGSLGTQASAAIVVDTVAPVVNSVAIGKTAGYVGDYIKQGGTYYVYANVSDTSPSSGLSSVTANVSSITTGQTARILTAGSYTLNGVSYNYRTASTTANATIAEGAISFTVTATDVAGNTGSRTGSVTVDDTVPTLVDVQSANGGSTSSRIEANDTIAYTFSEQMDPQSILNGWDGTVTAVTLRLTNNGASDFLLVYDSANTTLLPLNKLSFARIDYLSASSTITGTMTMSGNQIVITVGATGTGITTAGGTGTMSWVANANMYDRAGNKTVATTVTQSGGPKTNF